MRNYLIALAFSMFMVCAPLAHAGPGGNINGPGLCDYPGVGGSAQVDIIGYGQGYYCDFPREENGSVWRCIAGYGGVEIPGFSVNNNGFNGALINGGGGACNFVCPDSPMPGLVTYQPNPPGLWKQFLKPAKCVPLDPPRFLTDPQPVPGPQPEADGPRAPLVLPAGPTNLLPPVTNPGSPNPLTPQNPNS